MKAQLIFLFTFLFFFAQAQLQENTWYKVSKITDGDTFYVTTSSSEKYKIRLIGIDAPETRNLGVKVHKEYFGTEAKIFVTQLLKNKKVKLTFDVQKTDRYGRVLAYVYLENGIFLNQYLVEKGYAVVSTFLPNVKFVEKFTQAERNARKLKLGMWK
ncbi:MAG: thermonuclease family protein [Cloacibacterium sp.]|uniref:thermonuclease family protein n=1 Tax=Cloacibacterium sp. TaxID=1913682 RepID=UPI003C77A5E1